MNKITRYQGFTYKIVPVFDSLHRPNKTILGYQISFFSPLCSGNCIKFPHQLKLIGCNYEQAEEEAIAVIDEMLG